MAKRLQLLSPLKGEPGDPGIYVGNTEPTDDSVRVWIDPDDNSSPDVVGGDKWELIIEKIEIEEEITSVAFNVDMDENTFSLKKMRIFMYLPPETDDAAYANYSINGYGSYSNPSGGWSDIYLMCDIESMGDGNTVHIVWRTLGRVKTKETTTRVQYVWQDASLSTIRSFTWALFNRNVMPGTTFEIWGVRA